MFICRLVCPDFMLVVRLHSRSGSLINLQKNGVSNHAVLDPIYYYYVRRKIKNPRKIAFGIAP